MPERETLRPARPSTGAKPEGAAGVPTARVIVPKGDFLRQIPEIILPKDEVNASDLDNRDYFILSLLDGKTTIEELLDISGMSSDEAIAVLDDLVRRGIVGIP